MRATEGGARRAAIYLRISQDRENTRFGVDRHREDAEQLVQTRQWELAGVYEDNDVSGAGGRRRPAFERLLADVEDGLVDVIVAQEWTRLERNRRDGVRIIEAAQRHRVLLTFARGSDIDCTTAAGRLSADLFSAMARNEIEVKSERQSRAQLQRARQGRPAKGVRPLGYATDGSIVPLEAQAVRALFRRFAVPDGVSIAALAAALSGRSGDHIPKDVPALPSHSRTVTIERNRRRATRGLPQRPVPENKPWPSSTVLGILRNPRYAGFSAYPGRTDPRGSDEPRRWYPQVLRDEAGEPVRGRWEPIVDEDVWWAVQERLDAPGRKSGPTTRIHLGSGLYLCGVCERPVRASSDRYRCPAGHLARTRAHVDQWVLSVIKARLARPDLRDTITSAGAPHTPEVQARVSAHRARIRRARHDYDSQLIEGVDLRRIRRQEEAAIARLETPAKPLAVPVDLDGVLRAKDPVASFDEAELMTRRRVIDLLCTVRLMPHPRGRKGFDPETVRVEPKP